MTTLKIAHAPMQFSDNADQHARDADRLFARAEDKQYKWITGTEAGPGAGNLERVLRESAREAGYRFFLPDRPTDAWIAVDEGFILDGWKTGYIPVIPGSSELDKTGHKFPKWGPKGVTWVQWETDDLGIFSVASAHYLTKGRTKGHESIINGVDHYEWNRKLGLALGDWAAEFGAGPKLAFVGADANIVIGKQDPFFGKPLTPVQVELKKHASTGHGEIDLVATYDKDGRVTAKDVRVFNDKKFFLNADHFLMEVDLDVKPLKAV